MLRHRLIFCSLVLLVFICGKTLRPAAAAEGWRSLFNGKDLSGWKSVQGNPAVWKAEDGVLLCEGEGGGWLSTKDEFDNFDLELEFRVPPGGNSGVFLRAPHQNDPAYAGMEIQVLDDYAPEYADLKPTQYTGSIYDVVPAKPRVTKKAGEWQKMQIVCDGRTVKVTLNGTPIVNANLDEHKDKLPTHPGLARTTGYLGLQNHGSKLEYRNLKIRPLP